MTRRRVVVLSSAFVLLGLGVLAGLAIVSVTQTQFGRDRVRSYIEAQLASGVQGTVHIWSIGGSLFTGATIDSLEIRGMDDSLFVKTGRVTVAYDPRDFIDKRVLLSRLEIEGARVYLRKDSTGTWNFRRIFPPGPKRPRGPERSFGDFIRADSVVLRDASLVLTMPWEPNDSLRGAKRDSAIAYNLERDDAEIRRAGGGFARTRRWTNIDLASGYVRLAHPDSAGRLISISRLDADESDPPFDFRNVRGVVRQHGDSLWLDVKHFDLPGSTGLGAGKVVWGSDLPVRYDLRIVGDSVSLADVSWVYPTLPRTGGGSMVLEIQNQKDLSIIDYRLTDMDVRTTRSRLRGDMTFGVGGPVLIVKDLELEAEPVNFDLLRTFAGGPFPYDWQGDLRGTIRARGGPLNRFRVDEANIVFQDANVPGAVTRAAGRGELDILDPEFTAFRGFAVDVAQLDLRTIQFVNPSFPRVTGTVSGRATLDSVWVDVRFRNADLTHRDGPDTPTRATGSGRVTLADEFVAYDLALNAEPLSFTTLARSYPAMPLRGAYTGPMRIQGTIDDLAVTTELTGPAGTLAYDGRVDAYPSRYAARGTLRTVDLDLRTLLANDTLPATTLNLRAVLDVAADSASRDSTLASLTGRVDVEIDRSFVDSLRVYPSVARVAFADGRARIDTVRIETTAAVIAARGAIGLARGVSDSLNYTISADSLGGLRRYLGEAGARRPTAGSGALTDSLGGGFSLTGFARGGIDSLSVDGSLQANGLWIRGDQVAAAIGTYSIADVTGNPSGTVSVRLDTVVVAGVSLINASAELRARDRESGVFAVNAVSANGPELLVYGAAELSGDTTRVRLDTLALTVREHTWNLARSALIELRPDAIVLDSIRLRDVEAGSMWVAGSIPDSLPVSLTIGADSVDLGDVGELAQTAVPLGGYASLDARIEGPRAAPVIKLRGALDAPRFGEVRLDRATITGDYAARRLDVALDLFRGAQSALAMTASLPLDLALMSVADRRLSEPLRGEIRSDSVELGILEAVTPAVQRATGKFTANLDLGGTWEKPELTGNVLIVNGGLALAPLGTHRVEELNADLQFFGDSVHIGRFTAVTRDERVGTLDLSGGIGVADLENPKYDVTLRARDFHIIERPRIAHLDVSAELRLVGSYEDGSTLTGGVTVERGTVYIPELIEKNVINLDNPDLYNIIDTTLAMNRPLMPKAPPDLLRTLQVENVQVRMGNEVWLRSAEANINLGGTVNVTVDRATSRERPFDQLALDGELRTNRGTYRLNLGIVQRTFVVETGSVRFLGDADFNPVLDINAIHRVRRLSSTNTAEQDVRVRVHIGGTLAQPRLELVDADSLGISQTDLVSYLITGAPNFAINEQGALGGNYATILLRSFGSYLGDRLRGGLGLFDVVDVELGRQSFGFNNGLTGGLESLFAGARLGVGEQLSERAYLSVDAGLCQVWTLLGGSGGGAASGSSPQLFDLFGVKIDYRLDENLGLSFGYEPSTNALLCTTATSARGFALTPRQWGFDIFRTWRF